MHQTAIFHHQKQPQRAKSRKKRARSRIVWIVIGLQFGFVAALIVGTALGLGAVAYYGTGQIVPGVSVSGVDVGGMTVEDAALAIRAAWDDPELTARDGARTWPIAASEIGLTIDPDATAARAAKIGRDGGIIDSVKAFLRSEDVPPVVVVDPAAARAGLEALADRVEIPAQNAAVRIDGTQVAQVDAVPGRTLDIEAALTMLAEPDAILQADAFELPMHDVQPAITDVTPILTQARQILSRPFGVRAYNPFTDQKFNWPVDTATLASWLAVNTEDGQIALSVSESGPAAFLNTQSVPAGYGFDIQESAKVIREAVAASADSATLRIHSLPAEYTVRAGDTLNKIAWAHGIPPFFLAQANPEIDADAIGAGDKIIIPSRDDMLPLLIVPGKRIIVDISDLRLYVYENGQMIKDFGTSTGIDRSPTLPGIFQIRTHEVNAYASNWDLYMPHFMGVYEAAPGFMNGIHGLPTRGGHTLVWRDALGSYRTSYGCIILGLQEAEWLYNWAEEGVIVEIRA